MADSSHSPTAHSSINAIVNENSTVSTGRMLVPVDLQCPVTPQLNLKLSEVSSNSSNESDNEAVLAVNLSGARVQHDSSARTTSSPPPNCAICLGRCKNKCFTDSCMHQFCFKCLCEWSKVKPECPLCKQIFKSIIHNVKSIDQFEEYHVLTPPTLPVDPNMVRQIERNLRLPYLMTSSNSNRRWDVIDVSLPNPSQGSLVNIAPTNFLPSSSATGSSSTTAAAANVSPMILSHVQNQFVHRGELLEMYRQEYPDGIPIGESFNGTLSHLWRRYVYDRKLYALPVCDVTGRFRQCTARFYRDNPAQIHRLMPWINRDIICLLRNTEHDVTSVLECIKELLSLTDILKPYFRRRLQPILGARTAHFIHELHNFARSPYDMIGYDRRVQYSPRNTEEVVVEFSLSSSSSGELHSTEDEEPLNVDGDIEGASIESGAGASAERRTRRRARNLHPQTSTDRNARDYAPMINLLSFSISITSEGAEVPGVSSSTSVVSGLRNSSANGSQSTAINLTTHNRSSDIIELDDTDVDNGTTTSALTTVSTVAQQTPITCSTVAGASAPLVNPIITENIELSSTTSSECEFVLERKPPHLRTPEMVSLNSESDSDVVFVAEAPNQERQEARKSEKADGADKNGNDVKEELKEIDRKLRTVNTQDLYNVGASTSAGLRTSGRQCQRKPMDVERNKLKRVERRKRSVRNNKRDYCYDSSTSSDSDWTKDNDEKVRNSRRRSGANTRAARRTIRRSARIKKRRYNIEEEDTYSPRGTKEFESDDGALYTARPKRRFKIKKVIDDSSSEVMSEENAVRFSNVNDNEECSFQVGLLNNETNDGGKEGEGEAEEDEEDSEEKYNVSNLHVDSNCEDTRNLTANNTNTMYNELTLALAMADNASPASPLEEFQQVSPPNPEEADVKSQITSQERSSIRSSISTYTSVTSSCSESSATSELSSSSSSSSNSNSNSSASEDSDSDNVAGRDQQGSITKSLERKVIGNLSHMHRELATDTLDAAEMLTSMRDMHEASTHHSEAFTEETAFNNVDAENNNHIGL